MSKPYHPKKVDAGKTKQQLIDELDSLRRRLGELESNTFATNHDPLLDNILDISADAIISIDEDQCIRLFNQGAQRIFGYETREVIGKPLDMLIPQPSRSTHNKFVEGYSQSKEPNRLMGQRTEIQGLKKDGTQFPASASISRIEAQGEVTLTVCLSDITRFREIESAVQKQRGELEHMNRIGILGEVSASLAHQLNQPLTAMLSNAQVLKRQCHIDSPFPEGGDEIISDLISDARRAGEVIKELKILMKPQESRREVLNITQIIGEIAQLLRSELLLHHVEVKTELALDLPAVSGNHIQLQQVLLNLVVNALEAMEAVDQGDRKLLISSRLTTPTDIEIRVQDSGIGFKTTPLADLMETFYTTKKGGMGMGLAISQTVMRNHGGELRARNNKGAGASFSITLPVLGAEAANERSVEDENAPKKRMLDETKIFIVDDDPSVLKALSRLLRSAGYMVETFSSAEAFLQCEHYGGWCCLLVDLHMPGKTGIELQTELNNREYTMPIIFMTGAGDIESGITAMRQGAMDFLEKPVDDEKLLGVIARAVEIDHQARDHYAQRGAAKEKIVRLTPRETEVMELVVKGQLNKQIAYTMGISEKTVKTHRGRVMQKLQTRSLAELIHVSELAAQAP